MFIPIPPGLSRHSSSASTAICKDSDCEPTSEAWLVRWFHVGAGALGLSLKGAGSAGLQALLDLLGCKELGLLSTTWTPVPTVPTDRLPRSPVA